MAARVTSAALLAIEWVTGGRESGPNARPTRVEWTRELRDAWVERGIPFFWKQWGGPRPKSGGRVLDGCKWCEVPGRAA
jgi:protein gp37